MTLQTLIVAAEELHVNIDKAMAAARDAGKAVCPFLTQARAAASLAIGHLNSSATAPTATANTPPPQPDGKVATAPNANS